MIGGELTREEPMSVRLGNITFDCEDALVVGNFWSQALGRPLDPAGSSGYCSIGLSDAERTKPAWFFEKVPESKTSKNRMHVDLVDSNPAVVQWLVSLGASVVAEHSVDGGSQYWTVMQDPEGNEFCISSKSYVG
jgi:hypothetical protein